MEQICASAAKCPIFNGILKDKEIASISYRRQYCEKVPDGWNACKRFLTKTKFGICPPDLLPNSSLTLEEIAIKYSLSVV